MHLCYIDETGDNSVLDSRTSNRQPLIAISGLFVDAHLIKSLTEEFLEIKRTYYPSCYATVRHQLDALKEEIKGNEIRNVIRSNDLDSIPVKHQFRFLDSIFDLAKKYELKIVGRIWIKELHRVNIDQAIYTTSTQIIAERFQRYLYSKNSEGMIIADFRDTARNSYVAHSLFTQKFRKKLGGDAYPLINETVTFGNSKNHACLQLSDIFCSAIIYPCASRIYCHPTIRSVHTHPRYDAIHRRYKRKLKNLQFHYWERGNTFRGITVLDGLNNRPSWDLFA